MQAVRAFADGGGVVYAESGGLIALSQSIQPLDELPSRMGELLQGVASLHFCLLTVGELHKHCCGMEDSLCLQHTAFLRRRAAAELSAALTPAVSC